MKNRIILFLLGVIALTGCNNDEENKFISFAFDTEHNSVEGSFVQGAELLSTCQAVIRYAKGAGGSATFSSDEINGMYIPKVTLPMQNGEGIVKVPVVGSPVELGLTYIPVYAEYLGTRYETTVSVVVFEDTDPDGIIDFQIATEPITGLNGTLEIPFSILPTMAAVTVADIPGLITKVSQDLKLGKGILSITSSEDFISGTLDVSASFGAREPVVKKIDISVFMKGDGTAGNPYEVTDEKGLSKIRFGLSKAFKINNDITIKNSWIPVGTSVEPFNGILDGGNYTVNYHIDAPANDAQGFFGYIGGNAQVKNLTLDGNVTGNSVVAGFAAYSDAVLINCNSDKVKVKGQNILAAMVAAGTKKDARILTVGNSFPTLINIPQGAVSADVALDVLPRDIKLNVLANETRAEISYAESTGMITADISKNNFVKGAIEVEVILATSGNGSNVAMQARTITIDSQKMNEGGDGTVASPYIIADESQLVATMINSPDSYIVLKNDILLNTAWIAIDKFTGDLDGKGYAIRGLSINTSVANSGLVKTNSGKIHHIVFPDVNITTSASFGTIAGINTGVIENIEVIGTINSTNTGDILGGIAGENQGQGVINNCYVNAQITATCGMVGGVVGRNKGTGTGVKVMNCTSEGTITVSVVKTRIAGIVGRGEGPDLIKGCLSSMAIVANTTGANGVGGIFGANNNNDMRIEECLFTGSVRAANDVGGIAGVGVNVKDCLVEGARIENSLNGNNGNAAGVCGTNKIYTKYCIVRDSEISGISGTGKAISGINGNYQNNGTTTSCLIEKTTIKGGAVKRISAIEATGLGNNWANDVILLNGAGDDITDTAIDDIAGLDGGNVASVQLTQVWFESLGFDFVKVWEMKDGKPVLKNVGYKK